MGELTMIWESIVNFFKNDARYFNWPVLIWPAAMIVFVIFFFRAYSRDMRPRRGSLEWIEGMEKPRFSLLGTPGRLRERDWLCALILTVVYGVLAFAFAGDASVPQSFWKAELNEPTITLDLGGEYNMDTVMYYTGLTHGSWTLEFSADGEEWRTQPKMNQDWGELFRWVYASLEDTPEDILWDGGSLRTRYVRATASTANMELGELVLVVRDQSGNRSLFDTNPLREKYPQYDALFDEQVLIPSRPTQNNGTYFDEIYHARTAYEYIRGVPPTETSHPPLGKALISLGVQIFGMTPFGWRFMAILFGILMVPLLYVLIKNLFDSTTVAVCGTAIFAFENMHFSQTHWANIDVFTVFFIIAMYLFMYRFISSGPDAPFRKVLPSLFLCGLSFGLGAACKWPGIYAAAGLLALYVGYLVWRGITQSAAGQSNEYLSFLFKTLAASLVCFVLVPFAVYTASYLPYATANGEQFSLNKLLEAMWNNQDSMLGYHGKLEATHPFQSRWWEWMLDIRPILYYSHYSDGFRTLIGCFTNPLVTIGGLVSMVYALADFFRRKSKTALFIVVGFLSQIVPWMFVSRITFEYHYFYSMIFLTLAICYVFSNILRRNPERKYRVYAFTAASLALFILLLPPTAGIPMPDWYSQWFVRWLPSWPF